MSLHACKGWLFPFMLWAMSASAVEPYAAPPWLPGGNLQTLYTAALLRGPDITYRRERWE